MRRVHTYQRQIPARVWGMVAVHLLEDLHHVSDAILWCMRICERPQRVVIWRNTGRQPHRCTHPAVDEMRAAVRKSIAAKRGSDLRHHGEIRGGIGESPSGHWIGCEGERDHADDGVAISVTRGADVKVQHSLLA